MNGWHPARPPWETQDQPALPADDEWYGERQGSRVEIKPHDPLARGARSPRYAEPGREAGRGVTLAVVIAGFAASVGIAYGAVQLTHVRWGQAAVPAAPLLPTAAPLLPTAAPALSPAATSAAPAPTDATTLSGYLLTTPATAGGYTRTSPMSATVTAIGTSGADQLMTAVEAAGGQPSGNVSGQYLILGDQYLGYAGYNGTFSPAAVLAAFKAGASSVTTEDAGPHGGAMACGEVSVTSPVATNGTACVWATATTVGMVEFYGSGGSALESVLHPKAAADTMKFRTDVEATK
jgi:hypothetical protein